MAPLTALHLCSGYGGFELALRSVARVRTVCHVERDPYAAAVLVERMGQARLDQAPIWDDLVTFNGSEWRGRVDLITAGFPCQPFSAAGKQLGTDDERWLWPDIARIIRDVEPRYVILENVTNVVRHGLPEVLHDLAALGFDAEWGCLEAGAVGASQERERFWLLAYATGLDEREPDRQERTLARAHARVHVGRSSAPMVNADSGRLQAVRELAGSAEPRFHGNADGPVEGVPELADTDRSRCEISERSRCEQEHAWPPGRGDTNGWQQWVDAGGPEPVLRRHADGPPNGLGDALHLLGNGLVPQCAAEAIRQLAGRN